MKLRQSDADRYLFELSDREYLFLARVLRLYPLVPPAHHQLTSGPVGPENERQNLLDEALAEERERNRHQVAAMLDDPRRFRTVDRLVEWTLAVTEFDWVLQVLNDVRVGAWIALGEPDPPDAPDVNPANALHVFAMIVAGQFQGELLKAVEPPASSQPPVIE